MLVTERHRIILDLLSKKGFVSFQELQHALPVSPATLRRDLSLLQENKKLLRVRGGAQAFDTATGSNAARLQGVPFHENVSSNSENKARIGKAAVTLCNPGDAVIIDGGSTTLQMCPHLEPLGLSVMTNSLHIVSALLPQNNTSITMAGGVLFREQNIILNPFDDKTEPNSFHASKMFLGCAAITHFGLMQGDIILTQSERKLFRLADELILLADSSKFTASAGHLLCNLGRISTLITDAGISAPARRMIEKAGLNLIIAG